ncbi:hypothetical protein ACI3ER_11440 [Bacillus sp. Wb]
MELKFKPKQKVNVEGKDGVGEIKSAQIRAFIDDKTGEILTEEKYFVKFEGAYIDHYPVEKIKLAIDNMDRIDPKNEDKINKLIIDAHIDNGNFAAIREMNAKEDVVE